MPYGPKADDLAGTSEKKSIFLKWREIGGRGRLWQPCEVGVGDTGRYLGPRAFSSEARVRKAPTDAYVQLSGGLPAAILAKRALAERGSRQQTWGETARKRFLMYTLNAKTGHTRMGIAGGLCALLFGCQSGEIFHRASGGFGTPGIHKRYQDDDFSDIASEMHDPGGKKLATSPFRLADFSRRATSQPTSQPVRQRARKRTYTAPRASVRQMSLIGTLLTAGAIGQTGSGGQAAAEFSASSVAADLSGGTGLSGTQGIAPGGPGGGRAGAVTLLTSEQLQRGSLLALSLVRRNGNRPISIFTPQASRATGPGGLCRDLVRAGFFNGDLGACERHFHR